MNRRRRLFGRVLRAAMGLILFSFGVYLTIQANIGLAPWDCLSMGLSKRLPLTYGTASILVSVSILILDLLLKEKIGIGTLLDATVCGVSVDIFLALGLVPVQNSFFSGMLIMLVGMFIMSLGQILYMSAGLCCGPRDSFLVGIGKRLKKTPIGAVNILILLGVLAVGFLLGGKVGIGTIISALGIGIIMQITFCLLKFEPRDVKHEGLLRSVAVLLNF